MHPNFTSCPEDLDDYLRYVEDFMNAYAQKMESQAAPEREDPNSQGKETSR